MSCIDKNYMEYSIMTTNRCNMSCSYCINRDRRNGEPERKIDVDGVIGYIISDLEKNRYSPVIITFYGGEPLLEQPVINRIMDATRCYAPRYNLFTNGTLLGKENIEILDKMYMISVSIDGDTELHDSIRGKGSFNKTINNYLSVKDILKNTNFVAFITLTPQSRVFRSIMGIKNHFDNIFWFLENSPGMDGTNIFLKNYRYDLGVLYKYWLDNLRQGKVIKIIPFQGLYDIIEKKHEYPGLPCGIGENFQAIGIDGSIYSCEDSYHNRIGDIDSGTDMKKARQNHDFEACGECGIRNICAGRCVVPHINYSREKIEYYCKCSRLLVESFLKILPEVKKLVRKGVINEEILLNPLTRFTDVIP